MRFCYYNSMEMKQKENDRNLIKYYLWSSHLEKQFGKEEQKKLLKDEDRRQVGSSSHFLKIGLKSSEMAEETLKGANYVSSLGQWQ